jgi:anaerobic magnesium-protoporphyrin IX monomethyl ester cyclase
VTHRVNLVNPPSAPGTTANREGAAGLGVVYPSPGAFLYPPHTLAVAAASLQAAGYEVQAFDGVVTAPAPELGQADAIGVFVSWASLDADLAYIAQLRTQTSAKVLAFGPAMRFVGQQVIDGSAVDAVLVGEAEGFIPAAVQTVLDGPSSGTAQLLTPQVVQVRGYDEDGLIEDLDRFPFPAWELLPYERYALLTVLGSRGCPDRCTYCPYAAAQGHRFRTRSVPNILAELAQLEAHFQPARVVFRDPVFAYQRERVVELCTGMLDADLALNWECESRPEHLDGALLRLMQRAGCQWVKIGLETTDATLLQQLQRVQSAEQAEQYVQHTAEVVSTCREVGLRCRLFVMAGLPGQDVAMVQETRRVVERMQPDALNVKECEPYPGTGLPSAAAGDHADQMAILHQAQQAVQCSRPSLLQRGKGWLKRVLKDSEA